MEIEYAKHGMKTSARKININLINEAKNPYFFIKWSQNDKRYRVSTSFKYLNTKYGLHINIIRDPSKITEFQPKLASSNNINYLFSLLKNQRQIKLTNDLIYYNYIDEKEKTEIFLIERKWNGITNFIIVFFSLKYWALIDYIEEVM